MNAREQLLVVERRDEEVVASALERADAVDGIRFGLAEHDHRHVPVSRAAIVQGGRVAEKDEVGMHLVVDEPETVTRQMTLEKRSRIRLRLGEQQCGGHATNVAKRLRAHQMSFRVKP